MEKIGRNNYEVFFLDYFEGTLAPDRTNELFSFLTLNPDLKNEFNDFTLIALEKENQQFENKQDLKRLLLHDEVRESNFEQFCVAWVEGDLDQYKKLEFESFTNAVPNRQKTLELYKQTQLQTDASVIYFRKNSLKRNIVGPKIILKRISLAASVLIIAGIFYFLITEHLVDESKTIVQNSNTTASLPIIDEVPHPIKQDSITILIESPVLSFKEIESGDIVKQEKIYDRNIKTERFRLNSIPAIKPGRLSLQAEEIYFASMQIESTISTKTAYSSEILYGIESNLNELAENIEIGGLDGSGRFTIWDIANVGINGLSRLTGANIKLEKKRNKEGNVTALAFQSKHLSFSKKID